MATYIPGTEDDDILRGTAGDDIIVALNGADSIEGLGGNDVFQPGGGDDLVRLGSGRDTVEINPNDRNDMIVGFKSGEDTLKFNGFGNLNYADLEPHFRSDQEAVSISLDLDAAAGTTNQNLLFTNTFGIGEGDIVFVNDRLDGGNPEVPPDFFFDPFIIRPAVSDRIDAVDLNPLSSSDSEDRIDAEIPLDRVGFVGLDDRADFTDVMAT
jgi:hypothetical protein